MAKTKELQAKCKAARTKAAQVLKELAELRERGKKIYTPSKEEEKEAG